MNARLALIDMMKRVLAGSEVTNNELLTAAPDPTVLEKIEHVAWQRLSQWADDDDIRIKDEAYADMQRRHIAEALADLEAFEMGCDPGKLAFGDRRVTHAPVLGCLAVAAILAALLYTMFTHGFFMHGD